MSTGWVAGTVRARALVANLPGPALAIAVAQAASLDEAADRLAPTLYGEHARRGMSLVELERGLEIAILWRLRVLAGWVPFGGAAMVRALAGWFEVRFIEERFAALSGVSVATPYTLGRLAVAATKIAHVASAEELHRLLAESVWREPGGMSAARLHVHLLERWAARVSEAVPVARPWVDEARALAARRDAEAGRSGEAVAPASQDLWLAEQLWWEHVESDARRMMRRTLGSPEIVVAACALMAADVHRTSASIEAAARRGGSPEHGRATS